MSLLLASLAAASPEKRRVADLEAKAQDEAQRTLRAPPPPPPRMGHGLRTPDARQLEMERAARAAARAAQEAAALSAAVEAADAAQRAADLAVARRWGLLRAFLATRTCGRILAASPGLLDLAPLPR